MIACKIFLLKQLLFKFLRVRQASEVDFINCWAISPFLQTPTAVLLKVPEVASGHWIYHSFTTAFNGLPDIIIRVTIRGNRKTAQIFWVSSINFCLMVHTCFIWTESLCRFKGQYPCARRPNAHSIHAEYSYTRKINQIDHSAEFSTLIGFHNSSIKCVND